MRPIFNWTVQRGYKFGVPTFYNSSHTGLDLLIPTGSQVVAPFDGVITSSTGLQGGKTLTLKAHDTVRFMHLSQFLKTGPVKAGDIIALSGNTGTATTTPHLHVDVQVRGTFVDPEPYFRPCEIPLDIIGSIDNQSLINQVEKWSRGFFTLKITNHPRVIPYYPGLADDADALKAQICPQATFVMIVCSPAPQIYSTSVLYDLKTPYAIVGTDALACGYEISHMLRKAYNIYRGSLPSMDAIDTMGAVTDDQRYLKYEVMKPYTGIILGVRSLGVVTEKEVKQLQALEGYSDPMGVLYWAGKPVGEYLKARLVDKVTTIQSIQ